MRHTALASVKCHTIGVGRQHIVYDDTNQPFIRGLQQAWLREQTSARIYRALAKREPADIRRKVLLKLAATEVQHGERWAARLRELGAPLTPNQDLLRDRVWRWVLVQSGTDNALKRIESSEEADAALYADLARVAPTTEDRAALSAVQQDEQAHSRLAGTVAAASIAIGPQAMLDTILHRETWHKRGGGWIGQAIYGANDGLGSVFGIVTGVAGPPPAGQRC
jgi:rubrerythrin